ncbi:MAG TPA: YeeE/YedE family protein [Burkholderiales bacterium]|nr:YeeE/YedE family protein [Burkholderiales bacterium]
MEAAPNPAAFVAFGGFVIGLIFGAVGARVNFCTMGSVSDIVNMGSWNRMRMWLLAIAVAIIGANALALFGYIDLSKSIYHTPKFTWLSYIVGGSLLGIGMTLASGCPSKTLMRVGGGSLKSLVVFVFLGIAAYMTMKGLFGTWRVSWLEPVSVDLSAQGGQDLPSLVAAASGLAKEPAQILLTVLIGGGLLAFVFANREFRNSDQILGGVVIGLVIAAGWFITGYLGYGENPDTLEMTYFGTNTRTLESLSMVAPSAYTLELLMLWSDTSLHVTFGVAAALGMIAGALAYAVASRSFRWEGFVSAADTRNHIVGGILMGAGGVISLGCTIGQGLSGVSTLALGSIITFFSIIAGAAATMKYMYWKMLHEDAPSVGFRSKLPAR